MPKLEPHQERMLSYLDGELDAAQRAEFEAELASNESLRAEVTRQQRLRSLIERAPEAMDAPDPGELAFERLRRNILAQTTGATGATGTAAKSDSSGAGGTVTPIQSARSFRRWAVGGVVALTAAAAAIALVVSRPFETIGTGTGVTAHHGSHPESPTNSSAGTEIVRVEFGKMSGTYWEQAEGEDRVAIVWIDDTVLEEVGRP
jgi:anti-sigma factor RsiW